MKALYRLTALVASLMVGQQALAIQYITGHITQLEPTYMPGRIMMQMDTGNAACPAGAWLQWNNGGQAGGALGSQAVYATMLAALLAGKVVDFIINDDDHNCVGQFFHLHVQT
jgi:hypothetical protein